MIKKFILGTFLSIFFLLPVAAFAQIYVGAGPEYVLPMGELNERNKSAIGVSVQLENRYICQFWYGIRFDYIPFDKKEGLLEGLTYFKNGFYISPEFRYNFVGGDCRKYDWIPYAQGLLTLSSIGNTDEFSRLGVGGALGAGIAYSFSMFNLCWMLDLNAMYSAPNFLYRADGRSSLQSINVGLTLSVRL
ncbi:MAG: hypothetical protein WCT77_09135 [Bacteroidota bacterium]|jgi:hypothetical protein